MRAFAHLFATLDDLAWGIIVFALGIVLFSSYVATAQMPLSIYDGTVEAFALHMMIPSVMGLVGLTFLSALFTPAERRSFDKKLMIVVFIVLGLFAVAVFGLEGLARKDVEPQFKMYLVSLLVFSLLNLAMLKGEQLRAMAGYGGIIDDGRGIPASRADLGRRVVGEDPVAIPALLDVTHMRLPGRPAVPIPSPVRVIEQNPQPPVNVA